MAELKVELREMGIAGGKLLVATINGRQALHEGPRRAGHCVYCAGPCDGKTTECEDHVYRERRG